MKPSDNTGLRISVRETSLLQNLRFTLTLTVYCFQTIIPQNKCVQLGFTGKGEGRNLLDGIVAKVQHNQLREALSKEAHRIAIIGHRQRVVSVIRHILKNDRSLQITH